MAYSKTYAQNLKKQYLISVIVPILAGVIFLASTQGAKAAVCSERKKFTSFLTKTYKEQQKAVGLVSDTGLMEIYVSEEGTWSIIMTGRKGISCLIAAGDNWKGLKKPKTGTPS